jgi:lipopolysaccharide export system permease protein
MDTLDRYLIKELLSYFLLIMVGLATLFVAIDFLTRFWSLNMPLNRVLQMYLYMVPSALQLFVPVAALMATLLVLSMMSKQNEILALYSGGVGTMRIVSTFIATVATISTITFLIFDPTVPQFEKRRELIRRGLDPNTENLVNFNRPGFWYRSGSVIYNVGRFDHERNRLEGLNIFLLTPSFGISHKFRAKDADYVNGEWKVHDGFIVEYPESNFPLSEAFTERTGVIPEKPSDYKTLLVKEETMRLKELRKYINRNKSYGLETTIPAVNYHERVALIFTPLILVMLGISFSLRALKTASTAKSIAFCFLIVFAYLLLFRMTVSVGKGGFIPPVLAGWLPNIVFAAVGLSLLARRRT